MLRLDNLRDTEDLWRVFIRVVVRTLTSNCFVQCLIRRFFKQYDANANGVLEYAEMERLANDLSLTLGISLDEGRLKERFLAYGQVSHMFLLGICCPCVHMPHLQWVQWVFDLADRLIGQSWIVRSIVQR